MRKYNYTVMMMKKAILLFTLSFIYITSNAQDSTTASSVFIQNRLNKGETPRSLIKSGISMDSLYGKIYQGGYIFHFFAKDTSGLVMGTKNLKYDHDTTRYAIIWGCRNKLAGATGIKIGTGLSNSQKIVSHNCPIYDPDKRVWMKSAAELCLLYKGAGYDDWYLPSKDELHEALMNLSYTRKVDFGDVHFWTSSEKNDQFAWIEHMKFGWREYEFYGQSYYRKFYARYVRPIRNFN